MLHRVSRRSIVCHHRCACDDQREPCRVKVEEEESKEPELPGQQRADECLILKVSGTMPRDVLQRNSLPFEVRHEIQASVGDSWMPGDHNSQGGFAKCITTYLSRYVGPRTSMMYAVERLQRADCTLSTAKRGCGSSDVNTLAVNKGGAARVVVILVRRPCVVWCGCEFGLSWIPPGDEVIRQRHLTRGSRILNDSIHATS